jgi:hypothetical protein
LAREVGVPVGEENNNALGEQRVVRHNTQELVRGRIAHVRIF